MKRNLKLEIMKKIQLILLFVVPLLLLSCGPRVTTINPVGSDLSNYDTFAYLPNTVEVENKNYAEDDVNEAIINTVNMNLRQEGFDMDRQDPDLLVLVSAKTDMETGVTTDPVYARYPYTTPVTTVSPYYSPYYYHGYNNYTNLVGYDTDTYRYKEGTLIIDLIDADTKETVWKGVTTDNIYRERTTAAIADLVDEIFDEYPMDES
jgi:hypothetical protein